MNRYSSYLVGTVALSLIAVFVVIGVFTYQQAKSQLELAMTLRAEAITNTLEQVARQNPGMIGTPEELQTLCESLAGLEQMKWVEIFDQDGIVVAHSIRERVGQPPLDIHAEYVARILQGEGQIEEWDSSRDRYNFFAPIRLGGSNGEEVQYVAELVFDTRPQFALINSEIRREVLIFVVALIAIASATWFAGRMADRAEQMRFKAEEDMMKAQKLEAVGQLSAGVAHDFNNLLAAIQGCVEIIRIKGVEKTVDEELDRIEGVVHHASVLTQKLLTFSRRQRVDPIFMDLTNAVSELLPILHRLTRSDISLSFDGNEPVHIIMDPGNVEQIVTNLVINAQDAMPDGGAIHISVSMRDDEGQALDLAVLKIRDEGEGIPKEIIDKVFDPFFTTKEPGKGTGLGLSTVHGIVAQAGGDLQIDSAPDTGTEFTILLPLAKKIHTRIRMGPKRIV